jgi:hypothetical protein
MASQDFATDFGTIGTDVLAIGTAMVTLIQDVLTIATGGKPGPKAEYPFG